MNLRSVSKPSQHLQSCLASLQPSVGHEQALTGQQSLLDQGAVLLQALKLSKDFNLHTARVLQPCGDHRQLTGEITQLPASHMLQGLNPAVDCTAHTLRCFSMVGMGRLWPTSPRAAHHLFLYNSRAKNCYDRWTFFISLMIGNAIFEPKQAKCYPIRRIVFFSWMHLYYKVLDIRIISYYEFHE